MGALPEMEPGSAGSVALLAFPYVHGGSGLMTLCECLRHMRKKMRQSRFWSQMLRELLKVWTFSSNTALVERTWMGGSEGNFSLCA